MRNYKLREIADIIGGFAFKSGVFTDIGIPVIKIADIYSNSISTSGCSKVAVEHLRGLDRFKLSTGDIVMAMTGATTGKVGRHLTNEAAYVNQRVARLRVKHPKATQNFLWAIVSQAGFAQVVKDAAGGSAQENISTDGIGDIEIELPGEDCWTQIGETIACLDQRTGANKHLTHTLEEMSQALFKSWFVDFDPVVAKSEGRKPFGMSDDIAALFPDSFEESELGAVPKGWRVFGIGEISHNYDSKRIPLSASQRAIRQGSFPYYGAAGQIDLVDDYIFDGDFVLVGEDGSVVTPQGTPMLQFVTGKFWVNNHAHVLQGKGLITNELLYLCLHDQQIDGLVTGAVQPKLTQANLNSIKVPLPTEDNLMKAFTDIVRVFFDKIKLSREENSTLTSSRQILLTRLLSEGADFRIEGVRSTEATAA